MASLSSPAATPSPPSQRQPGQDGTTPAPPRPYPPATLNPRSCVTCRRRKVKCDKKRPCGNCFRAGNVECIYPGPGRAPRRPRVASNGTGGAAAPITERESELLKRLRRLEGVVQEMSGHVDRENAHGTNGHRDSEETASKATATVRVIGMDESNGTARAWLNRIAYSGEHAPRTQMLDQDLGRLVIDEGKSRYLNTNFWASLSQEVGDIREIFEDELFDHEETSPDDSPSAANSANPTMQIDHHSFILGYNSSRVDLRPLHPLPSQIPFYWQTYLENVDPLTKVVHVPTMSETIKEIKNNLDSLSRSTEALMFAIYHATIVSMGQEDVRRNFGVERTQLLAKYRFGVEQALAQAQFLDTSEIVTLQALTIFLLAVRSHDDGRFVFALSGLAIRIAQGLGLHRDGQLFGLSPFDTEMRRRLWWQLSVIDLRASEDHGADPFLSPENYDTQMPLNINDTDLDPSQTEPPPARVGATEMMFPLIRFHLCLATRRLDHTPIASNGFNKPLTQEERETIVKNCSEFLEREYLQYCSKETPLFWVAATIARLILAKLTLLIYHPFQHPSMVKQLSQEVKDSLLLSALEVIEYSHLLETEVSTRHWGWLFHTYIQWHAISYTLAELCIRDYGDPIIERAWAAVDMVFQSWGDAVRHTKNGTLWLPMKKLMAKARRRRQEEIDKRQNPQMSTMPSNTPGATEAEDVAARKNWPVACEKTRMMLEQQAREEAALKAQTLSSGSTTTSPDTINLSPSDGSMSDMMSTQIEPSPGFVVGMMPSPMPGVMDGFPTQNMAQQRLPVAPPAHVPWLMDESALADLGVPDSEANWQGWDDMMRDLQVPDLTSARGAPRSGMDVWF